jgi:hypothetical protein
MVSAYWRARSTHLQTISRLGAVEKKREAAAINLADRAVTKACNTERLALENLVEARPRSPDGVLALLAFQRELWSEDPSRWRGRIFPTYANR